jgi:hypothetical protein
VPGGAGVEKLEAIASELRELSGVPVTGRYWSPE